LSSGQSDADAEWLVIPELANLPGLASRTWIRKLYLEWFAYTWVGQFHTYWVIAPEQRSYNWISLFIWSGHSYLD